MTPERLADLEHYASQCGDAMIADLTAEVRALQSQLAEAREAERVTAKDRDRWRSQAYENLERADRAEAALSASEGETCRRDLLLQDLTPGGSEYVNDPERCAAYAKEIKRNLQRLAMEAVRDRKEADAARERMRAALEATAKFIGPRNVYMVNGDLYDMVHEALAAAPRKEGRDDE